MKRFSILAIVLLLGGCQTVTLAQLWDTATGTTVPPSVVLAAANSFDVAQSLARDYLIFCKTNRGNKACAQSTVSSVVRYVRAGRSARNTLETYVNTNSAAPAVVYNTLITAVANLQATPAAKGASQ